ncbi:MAG: SLC13 family permease [Pseudomonadota bacterium]
MIGLDVWLVYGVIGFAIIAYASDRWSIEFVSLGVLAALLLLFTLLPVVGPTLAEAFGVPLGDAVLYGAIDVAFLLNGFASPVLFTILALLVIGQALYQTDALAPVARLATRVGGKRETLAIVIIILAAGASSAFLNNTPVVVMLLPVIGAMALRLPDGTRPFLIPLSFASILGGTTTLIGSSTNLLVASTASQAGTYQLDLFDQTPFALLLVAVMLPYILFILPRILRNDDAPSPMTALRGKQFIAEQLLTEGHALVGAQSQAGMFAQLKDITIRSVRRGPRLYLPPFDDLELSPGDLVVVAAKRDELIKAFTASAGSDDGERRSILSMNVSEAMLAPGARFVGQSVDALSVYMGGEHRLIGIERRARMPRVALDALRLEAGDVFLLASTEEGLEQLRGQREVLILEETRTEIGNRERAPMAIGLFTAALLAVIFGFADLMVATVAAAFGMVATGCLNIRQATRAIDSRIVMMIGTALAMGAAMQVTGGDRAIADGVMVLAADAGPTVILSAFFLVVAVLTNILSNNATAVLFTPIALQLAGDLSLPPEPFVMAVLLAANCSFATPIGYQTNLLVMGPGHYSFADYMKTGAPLVLLYWLAFSVLAPWFFNL